MATGSSNRIRVFVSSTFSDLRYQREAVVRTIEQMHAEPRAFPEQSVAGEAVNAFLGELTQAHALVLLVTQHSIWVDQEIAIAEEHGIPIIELAELQPIGPGEFQRTVHATSRLRRASHFQAAFANLDTLCAEVAKGLASLISRRFSGDNSLRLVALDTYQTIGSYVGRARERLAVVQETSTLVLGPRRDRFHQEKVTYDNMQLQISALLDRESDPGELDVDGVPGLVFLHVFDQAATLDEIRTRSDQYPLLAESLEWIIARRDQILASESFACVGSMSRLTPFVIQDAVFAFPSWVGGQQLWHEQQEAGRVSRFLWPLVQNAVLLGRPATSLVEIARPLVSAGSSDSSSVVLLSEDGQEMGTMDKWQAHEPPGILHLAISVVVVSDKDEILLQRRSPTKYHFGNRWSNTCCSHPPSLDQVQSFARSRLRFEMGLDVDLVFKGTYRYRASDEVSARTEVEETHVFLGRVERHVTPLLNRDEAVDYMWEDPATLAAKVSSEPERYTPWLMGVVESAGVWSSSS